MLSLTAQSGTNSMRHLLWWTMQRLHSFSALLFVDEIRRSRLIVWYYRLLGAKLGRDVFLNTVRVRAAVYKRFESFLLNVEHRDFAYTCYLRAQRPVIIVRGSRTKYLCMTVRRSHGHALLLVGDIFRLFSSHLIVGFSVSLSPASFYSFLFLLCRVCVLGLLVPITARSRFDFGYWQISDPELVTVGDGSTINEHADLSGHQVSEVLKGFFAIGALERGRHVSDARVRYLSEHSVLRKRGTQGLFSWCL